MSYSLSLKKKKKKIPANTTHTWRILEDGLEPGFQQLPLSANYSHPRTEVACQELSPKYNAAYSHIIEGPSPTSHMQHLSKETN
jgi:hypothetical protein